MRVNKRANVKRANFRYPAEVFQSFCLRVPITRTL